MKAIYQDQLKAALQDAITDAVGTDEAKVREIVADALTNYIQEDNIALLVGTAITNAIGDKTLLTTSNKDTLVNAINELDVDIVTNAAEISRVENNVYTKEQTDELLKNVSVDLTGYATTESVDAKIADLAIGDYATKTELANSVLDIKGEADTIYTLQNLGNSVSTLSTRASKLESVLELDLDSTLLSQRFYKKDQIDEKLKNIQATDLSGYYTKTETDDAIAKATALTTTYTQHITYSKAPISDYASVGDRVIQYNKTDTTGDATAQGTIIALDDSGSGNGITVQLDDKNYPFMTNYKTSINGISPYTIKAVGKVSTNTQIAGIKLSDYYTQSETDAVVDEKIAAIHFPTTDLSGYFTKTETETKLANYATLAGLTDYALKTQLADYALKVDVTSMLRWKGVLATYAELEAITDATTGDTYTITEKNNANCTWIGTTWTDYPAAESLSESQVSTLVDNKLAGSYYTQDETQNVAYNVATGRCDDYWTKMTTYVAEQIAKIDTSAIDLSDYYTKTEATTEMTTIAKYQAQIWADDAYTRGQTYTDTKIAEIGTGGSVDLTGYYTITQTNEAIKNALAAYTPTTDLSNYYTKTETSTLISTEVSKIDHSVYATTATTGNVANLKSGDTNLVNAVNANYDSLATLTTSINNATAKHGDMTLLSTTNKDTLVNAINELDADIVTNASEIERVEGNVYTKAETDALIKAAIAAIQTDTLGQRATFDVLTSIKKEITSTTPNMIALKKLVNNASGGNISIVLMNQETILFTGVKHNTYGSALGYLYFTDSNGETYTAVPTTSTAKSAYVSFYKTSAYTANPLAANAAFQVSLTSTNTYGNNEYYYVAYALHPNYRVNDIFSSAYKNEDYWMASNLANYQINILAVDLDELAGITHLNLHYSGGASSRYSTQLNISVTDGISNTELTTWSDTSLKGGSANVVTHQLPIISYTSDKVNELIESIYKEYGL